ncbi:hypothetical protein Btru_008905 [Bulinus truncatus]|nr:hypothetical protein Btru_008905 [Bulinus truncatus]
MDLPSIDRVTRQRNVQLQKQLEVKIQILNEEYRLIKQDQEKQDEEMIQFQMCLKNTAPGLDGYSQPNTKAMSIKNPTLLRKTGHWDSAVDKMQHRCNSNCESHGGNPWKLSQEIFRQGSMDGINLKSRSSASESSSRKNSIFNKKIVLDARRRSFISREISSSKSQAASETVANAQKNIQTIFSKVGTLISATTTQRGFNRSRRPKYGREAFSAQERTSRNVILDRFNTIFTSNLRKDIHDSSLVMSPAVAVKKFGDDHSDLVPVFELTEVATHASDAQANGNFSGGDVPLRGRRDVVTSSDHVIAHAGHGTAEGIIGGLSPHGRAPRGDPEGAELLRRLRFEDAIYAHQSDPRHKHRPKTAPASYELKQRAIAAPRQQLVGILAEIEWRKAGIRAVLNKSKQLQHTIRTLTPFQLDEDENLSDS